MIVNPMAGNGRVRRHWPGIQRRLADVLGYEPPVWFTERPGHAAELARARAAEPHAWIAACGGDGTVHEVVNGLCRARFDDDIGDAVPALVVIPAGTGNDFARSQGLPVHVDGSIDLLASPGLESRWVDAGFVAGRYFVNVGGVGFDAEVAAEVNRLGKRLPGAASYVWALLKKLVTYRNEVVVIEAGDLRIERKILLTAVGTGRYYGGGMLILPPAEPADGLLDACIAGDLSRLATLGLLPRIFSGGHVGHPLVTFLRADRIRIDGPRHLNVHADGEIVGQLPVEFRCVPGAVRLLAPAPPPSPA
ncbi:MAG TPA: diacylglycerol kinase family protein [Bacillota bacterium]